MANLNLLSKVVAVEQGGYRHKPAGSPGVHLLDMAQPTVVLFNKKEFLMCIWHSMQRGLGRSVEKRTAEEHIILEFESCLALFMHTHCKVDENCEHLKNENLMISSFPQTWGRVEGGWGGPEMAQAQGLTSAAEDSEM